VHGDLKAANVLVSTSGRIKVVDFGLARRHGAGDATVSAPTVGGTPYTMSPEQLRGARPDSRSDVWAFGVLLQEIISGIRPFARPTVAELMAAILVEPPAPPPASVEPAVRRIIDRCLARDPDRRYQRAGEVLAALEAMDTADVRVAERGEYLGFTPKARDAFGVGGEHLVQELERDVAIELRIARDTLPPSRRANQRGHFVIAKPRAGRQAQDPGRIMRLCAVQ
jgi:serine/threonine protein kinase